MSSLIKVSDDFFKEISETFGKYGIRLGFFSAELAPIYGGNALTQEEAEQSLGGEIIAKKYVFKKLPDESSWFSRRMFPVKTNSFYIVGHLKSLHFNIEILYDILELLILSENKINEGAMRANQGMNQVFDAFQKD